MKYTLFGEYRFSQLTLGTVQLGMQYGISNSAGVPDPSERFRMLEYAVQAGINTVDTARQYGQSEQVLGDFLEQTAESDSLNLVSKFKINPDVLHDPERAWVSVRDSVAESLKALRVSQLPVCLLHKGAEPMGEVMKILPTLLYRLKEEGLIAIGGVSAYYPEDVDACLTETVIEALQIPVNIFDQRLLQRGTLARLQSKLVFARSVFLQGLFFMDPAQLTGNLTGAKPYLEQLQKLAEQARMTVAQLAFSFVRDFSAVDSIVFGAVNEMQVRQNVELLAGPPVPPAVLADIQAFFGHVEEEIITPGLWAPAT
ncbi:aldo/keto reductase [Larkinella arboricola]|nr:aldo/keto reductase [Larkinella arboricola]